MALAEALAQLRSVAPANPKQPPSILHSSRDAAKVPLTEQAALAFNSLSLLSSFDESLPGLADNLLLSNPTTRQTLDDNEQLTLSSACVEVANRLSPIFPLRHAQRVLEWLVNGLHAGLLAPDEEIDALLFSALPFHATPQFPAFVSAVVLPRPSCRRWKWLVHIAQTGKPASLPFLVKNCPFFIHRRFLRWVLELTSLGVPVTLASSFLVNCTARWILTVQPNHRRSFVLACVRALTQISKRQRADLSHLIGALIAILSAAVTAGVEQDVADVLVQTAVTIITGSEGNLGYVAVALLALVLDRCGEESCSENSALTLIQSEKCSVLQQLGDQSTQIFQQLLSRLLSRDFPDVARMDAVKNALLGQSSSLLSDDVVSSTVARLLDVNSADISSDDSLDCENRTEEDRDVLVSILKPLSRGRYAEAVDSAISDHFRRRANAEKCYIFVDKALSLALHDSSMGLLKISKSGEGEESNMPLLSALDHPSPSIRQNALEHLFNDKKAMDLCSGANPHITDKLLDIFSHEEDLSVLSVLYGNVAQLVGSTDPRRFVLAAGRRLLNISRVLGRDTATDEIQLMWNGWESLCLVAPSTCLLQAFAFIAGFILLTFQSLHVDQYSVKESSVVSVLRSTLKLFPGSASLFKRIFTPTRSERGLVNGTSRILVTLLESSAIDCKAFMCALEEWDCKWPLEVLHILLQTIANDSSIALRTSTVNAFIAFLKGAARSHSRTIGPVLSLSCKAFCSNMASSELKQERMQDVWRIATFSNRNTVAREVVSTLLRDVNLDVVLEIFRVGFAPVEEGITRIFSLRWLMHLVFFGNAKRYVGVARHVMVGALYSGEEALRREVEEFCKRAAKMVYVDKNESIRTLSFVLSGVPKIRSNDLLRNHPDTKYGIFRRYVLSHVEAKELPCPLFMSSADVDQVNQLQDWLALSLESCNSSEEQLCLLRALEGYQEATNDTIMKCMEMLAFLLEEISSQDSPRDPKHRIELVVRIVMVLEHSHGTWALWKQVARAVKQAIANIAFVCNLEDSQSSTADLLRLSLLSCFAVLSRSRTKAGFLFHRFAIRILLASSSKSSMSGLFAKSWLDSESENPVILKCLEHSVMLLRDAVPNQAKKPKVDSSAEDILSSIVPLERIGALEALTRWASLPAFHRPEHQPSATLFKNSLWMFIRSVSVAIGESSGFLDESTEFLLLLSLDALSSLYSCTAKDDGTDEVHVETLVSFLYYPGKDIRVNSDTATSECIRKSALSLVCIFAPLCGKIVRTVANELILYLLKGSDREKSRETLQTLVGHLLDANCDFEVVSSWLCDGAFGSPTTSNEKEDLRMMIASCCQCAADPKRAVLLCIEGFISRLASTMSRDELGEYCSSFLCEAHLPLTSELEIMAKCPKSIRCQLVRFHVLRSSLVVRLFSQQNSAEDTPKKEHESVKNVTKLFADVLLSLTIIEEDEVREKAMSAMVAVLPLPGLSAYLIHTFTSKNGVVRSRGAVSFAQRVEDRDTTLLPHWGLCDDGVNADDVSTPAELSFFGTTGGHLCSQLKKLLPIADIKEQSTVDEVLSLLLAINAIMKRFGSRSEDSSLLIADCLIEIVDECVRILKIERREVENPKLMLSASLRCIETALSILGYKAVPIIPRSLDAALHLVEWVFRGGSKKEEAGTRRWKRSMVPVAEAAVRVCTSVLEYAPALFGEKALLRLGCLLVRSETRVVEEVVNLAMERMPFPSAISAMRGVAKQLDTLEASPSGMCSLLKCLENGLKIKRKSEVKVETASIVDVCTKCLERGRDIHDVCDDMSKELDSVDNACGDLVQTLTLRLPESEFKKVFEKLVQWSDGGTLPSNVRSALAKRELSLEKSLHRAIPLHRIAIILFEKLSAIMVPYYLQLIDQVLRVISCRVSGASSQLDTLQLNRSGKKRRLSALEAEGENALCSRYIAKHKTLQDICLQGLTMLLKQATSAGIMSDNIVSNMEEALLSCFDDRIGMCPLVKGALSALAARISTMQSTADESREHSRQLLMALSRQVLQRTREDSVALRTGALHTSRAMAEAVGDEYLVTLPESMPVLAEVIDDENDDVQKAVKSFVSVMETFAGEPLMNQLK